MGLKFRLSVTEELNLCTELRCELHELSSNEAVTVSYGQTLLWPCDAIWDDKTTWCALQSATLSTLSTRTHWLPPLFPLKLYIAGNIVAIDSYSSPEVLRSTLFLHNFIRMLGLRNRIKSGKMVKRGEGGWKVSHCSPWLDRWGR